jgi:hypothetical protein
MFRRRGRDADDEPEDGFDEPADDARGDARPDPPRGQEADAVREHGPWDATELDDPRQGRIDFGGLLIPPIPPPGVVQTVETAENQVLFVRIELGHSAMEVNAFAAPRSEGIWSEVLDEIAVEITKQGGLVDRGTGRFGPELRARVQVRLPDGNQGIQTMRFVGVDGPRWFLRTVVYGLGSVQPDAAAAVDRVLREVVVVRGTEAMAPRDPIPLVRPFEAMEGEPAAEAAGSPYSGGLNPFERGPEITEVR